jgi:DMSO/TMAO reductase YedYZ molybdopterin-dependent catalytic subunit
LPHQYLSPPQGLIGDPSKAKIILGSNGTDIDEVLKNMQQDETTGAQQRTTDHFAAQHAALTRRYFVQLGTAGLAALGTANVWAEQISGEVLRDPLVTAAVAELEYLTPANKFKVQRRGKPVLTEIPEEKLPSIGLTRETWSLEVTADPESDAELGNPLSKSKGNALTWSGLMAMAEKHAVRFLHVLSCTNNPKPYGMGLWEGVPLREIIWLTRPKQNIRRVFYDGYHNDDPKQVFQSSLHLSRVLEEAPGELPVIACYKLNGRYISQANGGPVRLIVPGAYGNRSIKWLQRAFLTNSYHANDTYAERNNDVEGPIKTCAKFIHTPDETNAGRPFAVTGLAQVGLSGLKKVQYWLRQGDKPLPDDDPHLANGDWQDAIILPPPEKWGRDLPDGKLPPVVQADPQTGKFFTWPIPNTIVHWVALVTAPAAGKYQLRCRTIDANGIAQPLPRPFGRSGVNKIEMAPLKVV